mgnify:CR=1 FL=1
MGFGTWDELHPVAVLGISRLLGALDWLCPGLRAQEGDKERGGFRGFAQGLSKAPGGASGVAVVVEVEVALRDAGKAGEGEDGAGGQGDAADAYSNATGVSNPISSTGATFNSSSREKAGKTIMSALASTPREACIDRA